MVKLLILIMWLISTPCHINSECFMGYRLNILGYRGEEWNVKKDRTRIICLGDSVTQGMCSFTSWPEYLQKFMGDGFEILNAGVGGNNSSQCLARLKGHILNYSPNVIILSIGTNDIDQTVAIDKFKDNLQEIIDICRENSIKIYLTTVSQAALTKGIYIEYLPDYENDVRKYQCKIKTYNKAILKIGEKNDIAVIRIDSVFSDIEVPIFADRVHLNDTGSALFARTVLSEINR